MTGASALELVYPHLVRSHGKVYADRWLSRQRGEGKPESPKEHPPLPKLLQEALRGPISFEGPLKGSSTATLPLHAAPATAEAATSQLTACLGNDLSTSQLRTFQFLHTAALTVAARRGYAACVTRVTFFCPAEVVAYALGIHRTTLWRQLQPLRELGLLDVRPHMTTHRGQTVMDGCLWCIRLHPKQGKAPRLNYDELKHQYRDLSADITAGRTAYALTSSSMQQSEESAKGTSPLEHILIWALTPATSSAPVRSDCCTPSLTALETVLDVPGAAKAERGAVVGAAAQAIVTALGDVGSHRFYCKLLWNLLRRHNQGQSYFVTVYQMVLRAKADHAEGFARSAGALLMSRLKAWEVWDWLEQTPPTRVV